MPQIVAILILILILLINHFILLIYIFLFSFKNVIEINLFDIYDYRKNTYFDRN